VKSKVEIKNLQLTDEEIVKRVIGGEKNLYENLVRKYNLRLFRISMSIVYDDMEAEDIMQTTFLNAYLQLSKFQKKASFSTWLTRILINEILLRKKKKMKEQQMIAGKKDPHFYSDTPLNHLMNKELKTVIEKSIANLPEKYKMVFVMRRIEEMSTVETMEILKLTESTVKIRLQRAIGMLREDLGAYYKQVFPFELARCDKVVNRVMSQITGVS
jgi:RNA polymerase sigma factor (sigma-70 family)